MGEDVLDGGGAGSLRKCPDTAGSAAFEVELNAGAPRTQASQQRGWAGIGSPVCALFGRDCFRRPDRVRVVTLTFRTPTDCLLRSRVQSLCAAATRWRCIGWATP